MTNIHISDSMAMLGSHHTVVWCINFLGRTISGLKRSSQFITSKEQDTNLRNNKKGAKVLGTTMQSMQETPCNAVLNSMAAMNMHSQVWPLSHVCFTQEIDANVVWMHDSDLCFRDYTWANCTLSTAKYSQNVSLLSKWLFFLNLCFIKKERRSVLHSMKLSLSSVSSRVLFCVWCFQGT